MQKLTSFERARIIGARALQLSFGAPPLVKPMADDTAITLAKKELENGVLPFVVLRTSPSGKIERIEL